MVSILVFLELAPGHHWEYESCVLVSSVSILVFLELAPGQGGAEGGGTFRYPVSILVFLELAPGPNPETRLSGTHPSFNPCFSGTRARTLTHKSRSVGTSWFQSLFFWNSRPDPGQTMSRASRRRVSILVFLELAPGQPKVFVFSLSSICFNPCFSGTRARTSIRQDRKEDGSQVSILVFLELAPGPIYILAIWKRARSFNPCFSGTRARTNYVWWTMGH